MKISQDLHAEARRREGMEEMSERFKEAGNALYVDAEEVDAPDATEALGE